MTILMTWMAWMACERDNWQPSATKSQERSSFLPTFVWDAWGVYHNPVLFFLWKQGVAGHNAHRSVVLLARWIEWIASLENYIAGCLHNFSRNNMMGHNIRLKHAGNLFTTLLHECEWMIFCFDGFERPISCICNTPFLPQVQMAK